MRKRRCTISDYFGLYSNCRGIEIISVTMNITKSGNRLETSVHRKSTNTGLLLHYHRLVDKHYKGCLLSTMINHAYRLSSTPTALSEECDKVRATFLNLDYPVNLINSSINKFLCNIRNISAPDDGSDGTSNIVVPLPFKDQHSANSVKREMQNLSTKIGVQIKPVFQLKKISQVLAPKEKKPPIVNNQCVVYKFKCDLWTQIMSGTPPDTCTNALVSINTLQLEDTLKTIAYCSLI